MRLKLCLCFVSATAVSHESTNLNFLERKKYNKVRKKKTSEITPRLRNVIPRIQNIMVGQDQMNEDELFDVSFLLSSQQPTMTIAPTVRFSTSSIANCNDDPSYISPVNPKFGKTF